MSIIESKSKRVCDVCGTEVSWRRMFFMGWPIKRWFKVRLEVSENVDIIQSFFGGLQTTELDLCEGCWHGVIAWVKAQPKPLTKGD